MPVNKDQLHRILLEAVELPAERQTAFIEQQCSGDDELFTELTRLLTRHTQSTLVQHSPNLKSLETYFGSAKSAETRPNLRPKRVGSRLANRLTGELTREIGRDNLWMIVIACVSLLVFTSLSWYLHLHINNFVRKSVQSSLSTLIKTERFAVENWLDAEFRCGQIWAGSDEIVDAVKRVDIAFSAGESANDAMQSSSHELRVALKKATAGMGELRYAVWNREFRLIADSDDPTPLIGNPATPYGSAILSRVLQGKPVLWLQTKEGYITSGFKLPENPTKPELALVLPIFNFENGQPFAAVLIMGLGMQTRFEEVFQLGRFGETGETYAINRDGFLITESRFVDKLATAKLLLKGTDSPLEAQQIRIADPGGDISNGFVPDLTTRAQWPLTKAAARCSATENGGDIDGYADYRGRQVVGAWMWIEKYDFGMITEVDVFEAYETLRTLRNAFRSLTGLLGLLSLALAAHTFLSVRAKRRRSMDQVIGPFEIGRQIGEGGLAKVYLARHSLLQRDCAVKILRPDRLNSQNTSRFQREVQLAGRLTHPNSISIYDYGTMSNGSFYCAMEYIAGYTLFQIVELDGAQAPARVAKIMYEICRSLREAHACGMVHRDIKLQNIMLCERGGEYDCVKVLDFGLAKELVAERQLVTETRVLVGTPIYIAPERIANPACLDPRSDIFSLGVLAQVMLTGKEPTLSSSSIEAMYNALKQEPALSSTLVNFSVPPELDQLIHDCQIRDPAGRPQTVDAIMELLLASGLVHQWTAHRAKQWWDRYPFLQK